MGSQERFYADIMAVHSAVTGSCIPVNVKYPDKTSCSFIVDCGLFQEEEFEVYNKSFPFDAHNIKHCFITHCHTDHIGRLPLLVKNGFEGGIYTTSATTIFSRHALNDSYKVLKETALRNHTPQLYSEVNVERSKQLFRECGFEEVIYVNPRMKVTFFKNGHLIGAAMILVQLSYPGYEDINILFTGDYNNQNMFFDVPELPEWVLNLPLTIVLESTYGTMDSKDVKKSFEENILRCMSKNGTAVCMVFSLGRAQEILYTLKVMQDTGRLSSEVPIYFDGKLAQKYTKIYLEEEIGIKKEMKDFLPKHLIYVDKASRPFVAKSREQKIIVTTSGMGTYGPAYVYIPEYITRENCLLQFTGYTAEGTLGRKLRDVKIGENVMVNSVLMKKRAEVAYTTECSAHAKADGLIEFVRKFSKPKLVLVNHGGQDIMLKFSERIVDELEPKCVAILNRDYFFRVSPYGLIRSLSTKFR